jgi:hypothetical protein
VVLAPVAHEPREPLTRITAHHEPLELPLHVRGKAPIDHVERA